MGNGVNIAARLQTEAYPGGICISQTVYDVVKSRLRLNAIYAGELRLKNIQQPQPAYHVHPHSKVPTKSEKGDPLQTEIIPKGRVPKPPVALTPVQSLSAHDCLEPDSKVGGRYRVRRVLGQGGFGRSYLVEDSQRFGELCVLKEFLPTNAAKQNLQKALELFKREAHTLYQINHPQVPKFMACFTQGKRLFIVQEYINGVTYAQLLKQRKREGHCFTAEEVIQWLVHMLQVLDYIHGLKVVHRDISPDNIMYSDDRRLPVLIDFGLVNDAMSTILSGNLEAREAGANSPTIAGKVGYSPPEQLHLGKCFPSSDLYALGITAIVLLTGKYPRALMNLNSLEWDWQHHVNLSPKFVQVLKKMTCQKPQDRFQSAKEVLEVVITLSPNANSPLPRTSAKPINLEVEPNAIPLYEAPLKRGKRGKSIIQDSAFIEQCRQELTRCVGPMASVLIEDMLEQNPYVSPQQLVALLASQLSDGSQADAFTSRIHTHPSLLTNQQTIEQSETQQAWTGPTQIEANIDSEFLTRCRQALSQSIGPMADFLIEETLADHPHLSPRDLVIQLATEIPDTQKALEFQQRLL